MTFIGSSIAQYVNFLLHWQSPCLILILCLLAIPVAILPGGCNFYYQNRLEWIALVVLIGCELRGYLSLFINDRI